jgi:hypothetical protein
MGVSCQHYAPAAFYPRGKNSGTHWTGGWVGPRAGLAAETRRKILCLCRGKYYWILFIIGPISVWAPFVYIRPTCNSALPMCAPTYLGKLFLELQILFLCTFRRDVIFYEYTLSFAYLPQKKSQGLRPGEQGAPKKILIWNKGRGGPSSWPPCSPDHTFRGGGVHAKNKIYSSKMADGYRYLNNII